jgi:uncharacterized protein (TIGR02600 family)
MRRPQARRQGVALVIVLSMLVILSGLLVAFMSTAITERTASQITSDVTSARQLADSTINLAMAQIREATSQEDETTTWASQPGAIRTFSGQLGVTTATANGGTARTYTPGGNDWVFRLYSADRMKVTSSDYERELAEEVNVIEGWDRTDPLLDYADLNEPIFSTLGTTEPGVVEPRYPIIDPRAKFNENGQSTAGAAYGIVEGFDAKTGGLTDPHFKLANGTSVPYLPMPVKWLYVFRDGTMGPASAGTKENPIVGRTAFWTDDESCKLNINTASEGTYWDTPVASTERESGDIDPSGNITSSTNSWSFSASQPTRGEYQRYGGHPATTCLSPAMGWLWNVKPNTPTRPKASPEYLAFKEAIYQISPFLPFGRGTSRGATENTDKTAPSSGNVPPKLTITRKALYNSVDDLLFQPPRFSGDQPLLNAPLSAEALEKMRFFLTAQSRAPEINLYGRPRVTAWPVNADPTLRTTYDDLFAFTSTLGGNVSDPQSRKFFLSRAEAKSATRDYVGIPRNQELMEYLKWLTSRTVPGFGGDFLSKYTFSIGGSSERDQILTEIFDYTRAVNLVDTGTQRASGTGFKPYTPFFGLGQAGYGNIAERSFDWSGQVTPIKIGNTMGLGRFFTVSEASLVFFRTGTVPAGQKQTEMQAVLLLEMTTPMAGYPAIRETYWTKISSSDTNIIVNNSGNPAARPLGFCRTPTGTQVPMLNIPNMASHEVQFGRGFMPNLGFATAFFYYPEHNGPTNPANYPNDPNRRTTATINTKSFTKNIPHSTAYTRNETVRYYPYVSDIIPLGTGAQGAQTFELLNDLVFNVEIWSGESPDHPNSELVQTVNLKFPAGILPVPQGKAGTDVRFQNRFPGQGKDNNWDRAIWGVKTNLYDVDADTVRSLDFVGGTAAANSSFVDAQEVASAKAGDIRLGMARAVVPESFFKVRGGRPAYNLTSNLIIHGLTTGHGDPVPRYWPTSSSTWGRLAAGSAIRTSKPPILPPNINGVQRADGGPGDFDRGLSKHVDGALANKVDEGNVFFDYTLTSGSAMPYFRGRGIEEVGRSFFTPNRQLPSAVMFGSLPTGVLEGKPWQTLLFRPDREATAGGHPGSRTPPDHLFLDLFHLPIVEPYAISEPFSTAGKVNLNYVLAPFGYARGDEGNNPGSNNPRSYIRRDTALRGVLKSTKITAIKSTHGEGGHREDPLGDSTDIRFDIDLDKTLDQVETRLKSPGRGLFRSGSEICDVDLYPGGPGAPSVSNWAAFWTEHGLTGDNMRERPYAHIYPRITTKSNVYTVHMRCQAIRKNPNSAPNEFDPKRDAVVSEYRGSATVERYIDPNDPNLRNYNETNQRIDPYYRYRIVATKQFAPR